jgi:hypothetical protein
MMAVLAMLASVALAQWPRPVTTAGTVTTNDAVVFADSTGKTIKSGGAGGTNGTATAAQGAKADTAVQPNTSFTMGTTLTFVGTGFTNTITATATNFTFRVQGTNYTTP